MVISKRLNGNQTSVVSLPIYNNISSSEPAPSKYHRLKKEVKDYKSEIAFLLLGIPLCLYLGYAIGSSIESSYLDEVFESKAVSKAPNGFVTTSGFPDGWEKFSYDDVRDHFCPKNLTDDHSKPLPELWAWKFMRATFTRVVDPSKRWDDPVLPTEGSTHVKGVWAPPPYRAALSPGKGRGLFASRDIRKGELVHDGSLSDVRFPDAMAWRRFVFSLPREYACDTSVWHWMQEDEGGGLSMHASFDISMLMNSGAGTGYGMRGGRPNVMPESDTSGKFHAVRDIKKGEEILTDYNVYDSNWKAIGL